MELLKSDNIYPHIQIFKNSKMLNNYYVHIMIGHARFVINRPKIIHETIDSETVLVTRDTGNYCSLNKNSTF